MVLEIEIINWGKYNPRTDVKSCTWFRMSNDFFNDPEFYGASMPTRLLWVYILCAASKKMKPIIKINTEMIVDNLKIDHDSIENSLLNLSDLGCLKITGHDVISARSDSIVRKMLPSATDRQTDKQTDSAFVVLDAVKPPKKSKQSRPSVVTGFFEPEPVQDLEEVPASQLAINILTALNTICFLDHRPNKLNMGHINARIREKYTFEDFVAVIKHKQETWGDNPKMAECLRPRTLFNSNFDDYLQAAKNAFKPKLDPLEAFLTESGIPSHFWTGEPA